MNEFQNSFVITKTQSFPLKKSIKQVKKNWFVFKKKQTNKSIHIFKVFKSVIIN